MNKESFKQDHYKVSPQKKEEEEQYLPGRGAQFNTPNSFLKNHLAQSEIESIDDWEIINSGTQFIEQEVKSIVNKVASPDLSMMYSMNPYAGCEHGCIYCYARNVHEYWGYSAGLDFERKIIVKINAPAIFRKTLMNPKWEVDPIMLSGNTDCYQPAEKKYRLTRGLLEVCNEFNQPISILTKNSQVLKDKDILQELAQKKLVSVMVSVTTFNEFNQPISILTKNSQVLKDKDILQELAQKKLVSVMVSVTTFNEELRRVMEPRTSTAVQRLRVIEELSNAGIRTGVMLGPMIPGLNEHEMQRILKEGSDAGGKFSAYTFIRLNGSIKFLFHDWLYKNFPDRADKVWHLIEASHDGKVNDSRWGVRMRGEGSIADIVNQQYKKYGKMYGYNEDRWELNTSDFRRPGEQGKLF